MEECEDGCGYEGGNTGVDEDGEEGIPRYGAPSEDERRIEQGRLVLVLRKCFVCP